MVSAPPAAPRAWIWILAPLVVALLYALVFPLFAATPTLADVVPAEAVLTMRFKDLAAFDALWFRDAKDPTRPSVREAEARNLGGLPGVDTSRPIHFVLLEREQRPDPSMLILPVADAARIRARFDDPSFFLEKGYVRHAQYLDVRDGFAAVGGDRGAVRHLGDGGITAADLGEDLAIAVRVPEMVRFALATPLDPPWRGILEALGFSPGRTGAAEQAPGAALLVAPRLLRVASAWRAARMWSWLEPGSIRVDLEPAPGTPLARSLQRAASSTAKDASVPLRPPHAQAWLHVHGGAERAALAWALYDAGVAFPDSLGPAGGDDALGAWGRPEGGGLLTWASPSIGAGYAWTIGLAAPGGLPPLEPFHAAMPAGVGDAAYAEGQMPLTRADLQLDRTAPAGRILRRRLGDLDVVVFGSSAEETWRRFETWHASEASTAPLVTTPAPGWHEIAAFGLAEVRARTLLGSALERGGFLRALAGGGIEGAVLTDGKTLRLEARVVR